MGFLTSVIGSVLSGVINRNKKNKDVKTADPRVFVALEKKIEHVEVAEVTTSRADMYKDYLEKIKEAQVENEQSQEVETADKSVYEDMMQEIERLNSQVQSQNESKAPDLDFNQAGPQPSQPTQPAQSAAGVQAWTNSNGGSLQMRISPEMGAQKSSLFIPAQTVLTVIQYSENSVILDGMQSRFALVEHNGERGWILENYLNFN